MNKNKKTGTVLSGIIFISIIIFIGLNLFIPNFSYNIYKRAGVPLSATAYGFVGTSRYYVKGNTIKLSKGEINVDQFDKVLNKYPQITKINGEESLPLSSDKPLFIHAGKARNRITSIDMPWFIPHKNSSNFFSNLPNLRYMNLSFWQTRKVTNMKNMFAYDTKLVKIVGIQNWQVYNVKNMEGMFYEMSSVKKLNLTRWNTSKIENMNSMFAYDTSLSHLKMNPVNISNTNNMFFATPKESAYLNEYSTQQTGR